MNAVLRIALGILAATELVIGGWNLFAPESFYRDFPTVDLTPPFSEHFARDFGGATLGLAVVLIVALVTLQPLLVVVAGAAYSVFAIPHLWFHLEHLEGATSAEVVFLSVGNAAVAALGVLVVVLGVLRMGRVRRAAVHDPAVD